MNQRFEPSSPLRGVLDTPPDKSISHRAALLSAMGTEPVRIRGYLRGEDTLSTLAAVRALGAGVEDSGSDILVRGRGLRGRLEQPPTIDVGNAGTLMRLLPGWLAGQPSGAWTLDGDDSIRRRPVDRIAAPLSAMGARLDAREGRLPPFTIHASRLRGIEYDMPVASAQVKSCVLLAGLLAEGETTVIEPEASRDHTERMLLAAGADVRRDGMRVTVRPAEAFALPDLTVPGDPSSAAFHLAAAAPVPGSRVTLRNMGSNWTRTGFLRILERMGATLGAPLEPAHAPLGPGEPVCDLEMTHAELRGTEVGADEVPLAIDELPLVALLGCFADGETVVSGAGELRVKESDRIATVVDGLRGLGADIEATPDGFVVSGTGFLRGGVLRAHGDHRLAMLGAVAGLASTGGVKVIGMEAAAVSYPGFLDDLARIAVF